MSWLKFSRSRGRISLYLGNTTGNFVEVPQAEWPAHNNATSTSNGPWPDGIWKWSHYNAHAEAGMAPACHPTAYGCFGIHVFAVTGRPGIGVHAGRTHGEPLDLGGKTLGCIRVPVDAMLLINTTHNTDPLVGIQVGD